MTIEKIDLSYQKPMPSKSQVARRRKSEMSAKLLAIAITKRVILPRVIQSQKISGSLGDLLVGD